LNEAFPEKDGAAKYTFWSDVDWTLKKASFPILQRQFYKSYSITEKLKAKII
jgi:hypothetical protein